MFDLPWGTHKVLLGVTKTVGCLDQLWTRSVSLKRPAQIVPKRKFWWHFRLWWWLAVQHLWMCLVQEYQTISFLLRTAHQEIFDSQTSLAAGSWVDSTGRVWVQGTQSFLVVHWAIYYFLPIFANCMQLLQSQSCPRWSAIAPLLPLVPVETTFDAGEVCGAIWIRQRVSCKAQNLLPVLRLSIYQHILYF